MEECYICLEKLDKNIAILNCGHKYHFDCISSWIHKKNTWRRVCTVCQDIDTEIISIQNVVKNVEEFNIENELHSNPKLKLKLKLKPKPKPSPHPRNYSSNRSGYNFDLFCCNIL